MKVDWKKWKKTSAPFMDVLGGYELKMALELCKGPRVLDAGCGDGFITEGLGKHFKDVTGIDTSETQIEYAKKHFKNAKFLLSSIEEYDPGRKLFDSVVSIELLEHVNDPTFNLDRMKSFTKRGGHVTVMVPNALALNRRIGKSMGLIRDCWFTPHDREVGHRRMYDLEKLKKEVCKSGLKIKRMGGFFLKPLSNEQMQLISDAGVWKSDEYRIKYLDSLFEIGKELPQYATIIYAQCMVR